MPVTLRWHSLFAMAVCLRCVNANRPPSVCIVRARSRAMVDGNAWRTTARSVRNQIEQLADEIENIYSDLEKIRAASLAVEAPGIRAMNTTEALPRWRKLEDIGWKVRLRLMDTQRALNFPVRKARLPGGQLEQAREILRDIESAAAQ